MNRRFLILGLLLSGCTSFQHGRPLEAVPLPAPTRDRFEVWSKGKPHQLHALRIEHGPVAEFQFGDAGAGETLDE